MESHICNPLNLQVADKSDDHNGYIVDEPLDAAIVADVVQEQVWRFHCSAVQMAMLGGYGTLIRHGL